MLLYEDSDSKITLRRIASVYDDYGHKHGREVLCQYVVKNGLRMDVIATCEEELVDLTMSILNAAGKSKSCALGDLLLLRRVGVMCAIFTDESNKQLYKLVKKLFREKKLTPKAAYEILINWGLKSSVSRRLNAFCP